jgi:hypothetical protein
VSGGCLDSNPQDTYINGQLPKGQLAKNINQSILSFYAQVDFLAS